MKTKEDILKMALTVFGHDAQMEMMIEEASELIQAIQKFKRVTGKTSFPAEKSHDYSGVYDHLCEELADCRIVLSQMELLFDSERINKHEAAKLERLDDRIQKHIAHGN